MFDRDRSGSIELHEFQALWNYIMQWRQVFDRYDRDRSGAIDGNELQNSKFRFCCIIHVFFLYSHLFVGIVSIIGIESGCCSLVAALVICL